MKTAKTRWNRLLPPEKTPKSDLTNQITPAKDGKDPIRSDLEVRKNRGRKAPGRMLLPDRDNILILKSKSKNTEAGREADGKVFIFFTV